MNAAPNQIPAIEAVDFSIRRAGKTLLEHITLSVQVGQITAIIGPTGSGKSLFLRSLNRLCELEGSVQATGTLKVDGIDVFSPHTDVLKLRRHVGMIFSKPTLPVGTIFDNVAMAPRLAGVHDKAVLAPIVERCLRQVGLWDLLREHLADQAANLSDENQQRVCIARVLATEPKVLLFDEPTAHLDYPSAGRVEDLICELAKKYTVVIAAQTPQQASHVADITAFFWQGRLIECGPTEEVLTNPREKQTEAYVTGRV